MLLRIGHQFGLGEDGTLSKPTTFDVTKLFDGVLDIVSVTERTLSNNQAKKAMLDPANWPPAPELCSRRWASWLRCRVLYAIWPADRDITYAIFVERWMLAVIASLFIPYVNVAAWFLVGLFIVFGTRDEYQLLNYVATYRSFCFLFRGFMKLVFRYFVFYACISHDNCHVVHGEVNLFINRVTIVNYVLCWCCFAKYEYLRNVHGAIKEVYTVTPASDRVVSALIIWDVAIFFILVAVFSLELTFAIGDSVDEDDSVPAVLLRNMMAILGLRGFEGEVLSVNDGLAVVRGGARRPPPRTIPTSGSRERW